MPDQLWTAQLRIAEWEAQEDAPEIAFAERLDHHNRLTRLFMLAESLRPGGDPFVEELVSRIGEEFLDAPGSLTGSLQRVLRERHAELQEWNRSSLPRDQATYGISCLIARDDAVFLAQAGPTLALLRGPDGLVPKEIASDPRTSALGGSAPLELEFSQTPLDAHGWFLLLNNAGASLLSDELLTGLAKLPVDDVLPALYPQLRGLRNVSALIVASPLASDPAVDPVADPAVEPPVEPEAPDPEPPSAAQAEQQAPDDQDDAEPEPGLEDLPSDGETAAPDEPPRQDREQLAEPEPPAVPEADENIEPAEQPVPAAPIQPDAEPPLAAEVGSDSGGEAAHPDPPVEDWPERTPVAAATGGAFGRLLAAARRLFGRDTAPDPWELARDDAPAPATPEPPVPEPAADEPPQDEPATDDPPADAPAPPPGAGAPADSDDDVPLQQAASLSRLSTQAVGWPANPFADPPAPVLSTAVDADIARRLRPLVALGAVIPRLRWRRQAGRAAAPDNDQPAPNLRPAIFALFAMLLIFAAVAGVILVPESLRDSERSQFDDLLGDARLRLASAAINSDPALARELLESASTAASQAIELQPLDEEAQAIRIEIAAALEQVNLILQPADLLPLAEFSAFGPRLAVGALELGGDAVYALDDAGGRVFSLPLIGGVPQLIFQERNAYPFRFDTGQLEAAAPLSIYWRTTTAGAELLILDAARRLFSFTPVAGVNAVRLPSSELLGSIDAVAADEDAIYLLDASGGSVWRFPQAEDGRLTAPIAILERTDLRGASDLLVRSGVARVIFISSDDGRVRRFADGAESGFALPRLDRPLLVPTSLGIGATSGLLYTADRGNNRVVVMSDAGALAAQIRSDQLRGLRGVAVDEVTGRLYFALPDRVLTSSLPPVP